MCDTFSLRFQVRYLVRVGGSGLQFDGEHDVPPVDIEFEVSVDEVMAEAVDTKTRVDAGPP